MGLTDLQNIRGGGETHFKVSIHFVVFVSLVTCFGPLFCVFVHGVLVGVRATNGSRFASLWCVPGLQFPSLVASGPLADAALRVVAACPGSGHACECSPDLGPVSSCNEMLQKKCVASPGTWGCGWWTDWTMGPRWAPN